MGNKIDITNYPEYWDFVQKNKKLILSNPVIGLGDVFVIVQNGEKIHSLDINRIDIVKQELPLSYDKIPPEIRKNINNIFYYAECGKDNTIGNMFKNPLNENINIKVSLPYEIDNTIEVKDIPMFSILTGINGIGKTNLINQIMLSDCEIVSSDGWAKSIMIKPYTIDNLIYLKKQIVKKNYNSFDPVYKDDNELEFYDFQYGYATDIDIELLNDLKESGCSIDTLIVNSSGSKRSRLEQIKAFKQKYHLWNNEYYYELRNIAIELKKDIRQLSDDEIRHNSYFNQLITKQNFIEYIQGEQKRCLSSLYKSYVNKEHCTEEELSPIYKINTRLKVIGFGYYLYDDLQGIISDLEFFVQEDIDDNMPERVFRCKRNASRINYDVLSEGQKMIFRLAVLSISINTFAQIGNTIILDEPDAHFHPTLCEIMVDTLKKISENGTRVIISSHNPVTIARGYKSNASIYAMEKNEMGKRIIRKTDAKEAIKIVSDSLMEQISEDVFGFFANILNCKTNNIIFVEGLTDVKHLNKAIDILDWQSLKNNCDIKAIGGATEFKTYYNYITSPLFNKCFPSVKNIIFMGDCDSAGDGFRSGKPFDKIPDDVFYTDTNGKKIAFLTIQPPSDKLASYCPIEFLYKFETLDKFIHNGIRLLDKWHSFPDEKSLNNEDKPRYYKLKNGGYLDVFNAEVVKTDSTELIAYKITSKYEDGTLNYLDASGNKQKTIKDIFAESVEKLTEPSVFDNFKPTLEALERIITKFDSMVP